jgi:hypothetical protein
MATGCLCQRATRPVKWSDSPMGVLLFCLLWGTGGQKPDSAPGCVPPATCAPAQTPEPKPAPVMLPPAPVSSGDEARTDLNLLGKSNAEAGEGRRNENVQFNQIDNNAQKELNNRLGTTATPVGEFKVERNYFGAEFGNEARGPIHLAAGSYASQIHGQAYWGHNNSVFSARSFFQAGPVKPARDNQYGFNLVKPLWRGAFLTLDGSQQKIRGFVNGNVLVPLPDERTPRTRDAAKRRLIQSFLRAYPTELPNRTDIDPRALNTNAPQSIDTDTLTGQIDQRLGKRDRVTARHAYTMQKLDAFQLVAGQNPDTVTRSHTSRLTWSHSVKSSTQWELTAGLDRVGSLLVPEPNAVGPTVRVGTVYSMLGPDSNIPIDRTQNRWRYAALGSHRSGKHFWTWGGEVVRMQFNGEEASSERTVVYFRNDVGRDGVRRDAVGNFLEGFPSRISVGIGPAYRAFRRWEPSAFAGDVWQVRPDFTLSASVRYQAATVPVDRTGITKIPVNCDCFNLGPRLGWAWRLPRNRGVLRLSYGLQFGEMFPTTLQQLRWVPPSFLKAEAQAPDLLNPFSGMDLNIATGRAIQFVVNPNLQMPYEHLYSLTYDAALGRQWRLQTGYVGSRALKLFLILHNNRAMPVAPIPQTTDTINDRRPNTRYFDIRNIENASRAYFDAGRVSVLAPNWKGWMIEGSYWFSKALDTGGAYTNTAAGDDAKQGYSQTQDLVLQDLKGPSAFDQSHAVLMRVSYTTPRLKRQPWMDPLARWNVSLVFLAKSGMPFSVISGSDGPGYGNVDGVNGDRPNLLDPSILGREFNHPDTSAAGLPRSAFAFIRSTESRGNLGFNTFRRGGIRNLNLSVGKAYTVWREMKLHVRAESLNLLNTPQFAEPNFDLTSPAFGKITNTLNDGRTFRFQLRVAF